MSTVVYACLSLKWYFGSGIVLLDFEFPVVRNGEIFAHIYKLGDHHELEQVQTLQSSVIMHQQGMCVSRDLIYGILQECHKKKDLIVGRQMHFFMVSNGLDSLAVLGDHLIRLYASRGNLQEANLVFCNVAKPSVHSWQAIISAYATLGGSQMALDLYCKMQHQGVEPSKFIFSCVLKACGSMGAIWPGRLIHDQVIKNHLESDVVVGSSLIDMYAKCGSLEEARRMFDKLPNRNVVSWGAMISGYSQQDCGLPALELFKKMQEEKIKPDCVIFLCILRACGSIGAIEQGRMIHRLVIKYGLKSDITIGNTLVDMYAKCGCLWEARSVFDELPTWNVVSCGAMIAGYVQSGHGLLALQLFERMKKVGLKPNGVLYLCILKACSSIGAIDQGRLMHEQIINGGFETDVAVGSALIDMYAKCGVPEEAHKVLDKSPNRDVVSWGATIAGYALQGHGALALELFQTMQLEGIKPDRVTFLCTLKACGSLGAIDQGRWIHEGIIRTGLVFDLLVGNTLVDMYAKCGSMDESRKVFEDLVHRDVVTWNAIIAGYAQHGRCSLIDQCLENMVRQGLKPDDKTYTSILAACSHIGLVKEGCQYFKSMREDHGIVPNIELYSCIIDLLGRTGRLNEAVDLLETIPVQPDSVVWKSLLTSCRTYNNMELGRHCFEQVVHVDPSDAFGYVLMSNIYADGDMWEDLYNIQDLRKFGSAERKPGMAWIELHDKVHEFIVGNDTHPLNDKICLKLLRLQKTMKDEGHMPQLVLVLLASSNQVKEDILFDTQRNHTLSFGLAYS